MLIVVIDDEREFVDLDGVAEHYKTSTQGFRRILKAVRDGERIDQLWLDHDLGWDDDIRDFVSMMEEDAQNGDPWPVDHVLVHTSSPVGRAWMVSALQRHYRTDWVDAAAHGLIKQEELE